MSFNDRLNNLHQGPQQNNAPGYAPDGQEQVPYYGENPNQINYNPAPSYNNQPLPNEGQPSENPYGQSYPPNYNGYYGEGQGYPSPPPQAENPPYPYSQQPFGGPQGYQPYPPPQQPPYPPQGYGGYEQASFDSRNVIQQINKQKGANDHYASNRLGKRLLAFIIDSFISSIPCYLMALLFIKPTLDAITNTLVYTGGSIFDVLGIIAGKLTIVSILSMAIFAVYYVVLPAYIWEGRTLGKKIMKLRIVTMEDEDIPDVKTLLMREIVGKFLSSILWIGYIMILINKNHLGLHDKIAKTKVIDDEFVY